MPESSEILLLLRTVVDTTWRMVLPVAVLVPLGLWAGRHHGHGAILTILALAAGLALSAILISAQLRRVEE